MGSITAYDLSESVMLDELRLENALMYHLTGNHYPSLPISLIPVCKRVITHYNNGEYNKQVRLPKGITYKGKTLAPVMVCIDNWHLQWFLDENDSN